LDRKFLCREVTVIRRRPLRALRRCYGALFSFVAMYLLMSLSGVASAAQTTLAWDANTQPEVAGYMLHYGTTSGNYAGTIDTGKVTQHTVTGLLDGQTYYFAVTAYDLGRAQSAFSNEVSWNAPTAAPAANFTANTTSGAAPLSVAFTSTSTGSITGYSWNFGDGTASTSANPTHAYSAAGTYNVTLTVSGPGGTTTVTKTGFITVRTASPTAPVANFTANNTSGAAPLAVSFTSTSTGTIASYAWNFGDGTSSAAANPSHTYGASGAYTVSLTVTGTGGSDTVTKANYVTVTTATATPPVASFTADTTTGTAPLNVTFTSTSTGSISSYSWSFGDGTTSTSASPSHSYSTAGSYTVSLKVTGPGGSNTMSKTGYLTVSAPQGSKEVIVDNASAGVRDTSRTFTGTWCASSGTGFYGSGSLYSCGSARDTYRWSFSVPASGNYDLYVRWSAHANRGTAVPFVVAHDAGTQSKNFNQKTNGGQWMLHGRYAFTAGVTKYVEVSDAGGTASADAIRLVPASPTAAPPGTSIGTSTGLVAAYGFEEGTGTGVSDRSGKGNNGVASSATWIATGRFGKALSFNGASSWVTVADSPSLDPTNGMTLEAWVYPTASTPGWATAIMKEQAGGESYSLYANSDSDQPTTGVFTGGAIRALNAGTAVPPNAWTHLAATYDGATQRLYINGVQVASRAQTGAIATSSSPLRIGGNSVWGEFFKGYIDEVRIYSRALGTAEIQADMNKAVGP
jgi:PKD repeat protein